MTLDNFTCIIKLAKDNPSKMIDQYLFKKYVRSNYYWQDIEKFAIEDKQLQDLKTYKYIYNFPFTSNFANPGVYVVFGGRQIGKTTALKQFLYTQLRDKVVAPNNVFYLSCDQIVDRSELEFTSLKFTENINNAQLSIFIIDEITFIKDWQVVIKSLLDRGVFKNTILIITGSDRIVLEDASAGFPGVNRRGAGKDITVCPLSFRQMSELVSSKVHESSYEEKLDLFHSYLKCGGYLSAINSLFSNYNYKQNDLIGEHVYLVYEQWILSDFLRKSKDRTKLIDLLSVIEDTYASQISYTRLAQKSTNLSTDTVIDYLEHLKRLGVLFVLPAFDQNALSQAPKKDKKIYASDPFLAQVLLSILKRVGLVASDKSYNESSLVETAVIATYSHTYNQLYYIKAEGEVDLVYVKNGNFTPVEIKWTNNLNANDLKQISKYESKGIILSKRVGKDLWQGITRCNLVDHLLEL